MSITQILIGTIVLFISTNLLGLFYSWLVLRTSLFKKYRITEHTHRKEILWERLPLYFLNIFLILALTTIALLMVGHYLDTSWPSITTFIAQFIFIFIVDDAWFYFSHRWMHSNKWALKNIHSIHHRATVPFPIEYLYVHPLEWMIGMGGIVIAVGLIFIVMPLNIYVFWVMGFVRNMHEIHIHSDLDVPALKWIPFISSSKNHDIHHAKLDGNYASAFTFWDKLLNTEYKEPIGD